MLQLPFLSKAQHTAASFHKPRQPQETFFTPSSCYKEEKIWIAGHWIVDRSCNRKIWIPGHWETKRVIIPCFPPPALSYRQCSYPTLTPHQFEEAMFALTSRSFESSRIALAKEIIGNHCVSSAQVRDIMLQFSFESSRLEIAKFAFAFTFDKTNYSIVNEALQYPESIAELQEFLALHIAQGY